MRPRNWRPECWQNPYRGQSPWLRAAEEGYFGNRRTTDGYYWVSGMDCLSRETLSRLGNELRELDNAYEEGAQAMLEAINAQEALEANP